MGMNMLSTCSRIHRGVGEWQSLGCHHARGSIVSISCNLWQLFAILVSAYSASIAQQLWLAYKYDMAQNVLYYTDRGFNDSMYNKALIKIKDSVYLCMTRISVSLAWTNIKKWNRVQWPSEGAQIQYHWTTTKSRADGFKTSSGTSSLVWYSTEQNWM